MADDATTIEFFDEDSDDHACVIVRKAGDLVGLCVSLKSNGDVEVFLNTNDATKLIEALRNAVSPR